MSDLNEKQQKVVDVLFSEADGDIKTAMNLAGYGPKYSVGFFLQSEAVAEAIRKETLRFLAASGPKAAHAMHGLLTAKKGSFGDNVKLAAAKDLLDRADFKVAEKVEVSAVTPLFILPPKESDEE